MEGAGEEVMKQMMGDFEKMAEKVGYLAPARDMLVLGSATAVHAHMTQRIDSLHTVGSFNLYLLGSAPSSAGCVVPSPTSARTHAHTKMLRKILVA